MKDMLGNSKSFDIKILFEISMVLAVMLGAKSVFDYFEINGAGGLGIWSGILTATFFMRQRKSSWVDLGLVFPRGKREWFVSVGLAFLTVVIIFLVMGFVLDPILSHYGLEKPFDVADRFKFFLGKPFLFIFYLVTVVWVGAALGEELLMRGFLLNRLSDFIGKSKPAWIISLIIHSLFFGMLHIYQGLAGVITTTFIAVVFGAIYLIAKKRLFPVILAHLLINTITLTAYYLTGGVVN